MPVWLMGLGNIPPADVKLGHESFRAFTRDALAATQFALSSGVPLAYMQWLDGNAYDHGGLTSSYLADALVSLAACAVLALLLLRRRRASAAIAMAA